MNRTMFHSIVNSLSRVGTETSSEQQPSEQATPDERRQQSQSEPDLSQSIQTDTESTTTNRSDGKEELPLDEVFHILTNHRRRQALAYLSDHGGTATLGELAEYIAADENDVSIQSVTSKQRKRTYVALYQCHLTKMDDAGIISFNSHRGTVELNESAEQLSPYLSEQEARNWPRIYIGISLLGGCLFALHNLGITPSIMPNTLLVTTVLTGVLLTSVIHFSVESS